MSAAGATTMPSTGACSKRIFGPADPLWTGVAGLIDRAGDPFDLKLHGIDLLGARRWRESGTSIPDAFVQAEQRARVLSLAAEGLLRRVRESCDVAMILIKGPEMAAYYPDWALRSFVDVDVLVIDAEETQRQLLAAGFREVGDPALFMNIHHLRPLAWRSLPLSVEIHSRPKWPEGICSPSVSELMEHAVASATRIDGVLGLPPAPHAVVVAAHGWAHYPLHRLKDLLDVAILSALVSHAEVEDFSLRWGLERVWSSTTTVVEHLFHGRPLPLLLRPWVRHLERVRDRTVLEQHLMRLMSPFAALPPGPASVRAGRAMLNEVRRDGNEPWRNKLSRSMTALGSPGRRLSERERQHRE